MHVVRPDGSVASAGDAAIALRSVFPRTRWMAWLARVSRRRRERIARDYRRLAERRDELSERVPDAEPTVVRPAWVRLPGG